MAYMKSAWADRAESSDEPASRPWRPECRRRDVARVGRFEFERALRRYGHGLSAGAIAVLMVLASFGDRNGANIFPSQQTLATTCCRSVRHVRAMLREATNAGMLRRLSHGGGRPGIRNGRRYRVTPARYELTLPPHLADRVEESSTPAKRQVASAFPSAHRRPEGGGRLQRPGSGRPTGALDRDSLALIRDAAGVPAMTEPQALAAITTALDRAPAEVRNPLRYAAEVIRRDRAYFRPVPTVVEPPCPRHSDHPSTRCPECASARVGPTPQWRRFRERMRRPA